MQFKYIYTLLPVLCFNVLANDTNIDKQFATAAEDITAILEVVNTLGKHCDLKLDALGAKGIQSNECTQYIKSRQSDGILLKVIEPCATVIEWYEKKQALIINNPNYAEEHKNKAMKLVKDMKWAQQVCPPENPADYKYINKPNEEDRFTI